MSHVWSQHYQNLELFWSTLRRPLLLNWLWKILSCFEKYGKLAHLNHLPRWMTVKDTNRFYQSKPWLDWCITVATISTQKRCYFLEPESPNTEILTCCRSKSRSSWRCLKYLVTQRAGEVRKDPTSLEEAISVVFSRMVCQSYPI